MCKLLVRKDGSRTAWQSGQAGKLAGWVAAVQRAGRWGPRLVGWAQSQPVNTLQVLCGDWGAVCRGYRGLRLAEF